MEYAETQPPAALADIVRCAWELRGNAPADRGLHGDPALPDGSPELIVNLGDPFEHLTPRGRVRRQPASFLVGQITGPFAVRPTGRIDLVAIRFEAHGAALLHRPMRDLTDTWRPLGRLRGGALARVAESLRTDRSEAVDRLFAALARVRREGQAPDARVAAAVRTIRASHGAARLDPLARTLGLTPRSLQRLFAVEVGVSPKLLARMVRFHRVFAAARDEPGSLARVAAACGYYDQSHLVRDFQDFAGAAPARTLASMPEFTALFTA